MCLRNSKSDIRSYQLPPFVPYVVLVGKNSLPKCLMRKYDLLPPFRNIKRFRLFSTNFRSSTSGQCPHFPKIPPVGTLPSQMHLPRPLALVLLTTSPTFPTPRGSKIRALPSPTRRRVPLASVLSQSTARPLSRMCSATPLQLAEASVVSPSN